VREGVRACKYPLRRSRTLSNTPIKEQTIVVLGLGWVADEIGKVGSVSENKSKVSAVVVDP
jgi:hypothetical protein